MTLLQWIGYIALAFILIFFALIICMMIRVTIIRKLRLRHGFDIESWAGREAGDDVSVTYIEKNDSITLYGNSDDFIIRFPDEELWVRRMPDIFKLRRNEILERLVQNAGSRFKFEICSDRERISIMHFRKNEKGETMSTDPLNTTIASPPHS